MEIPSGWLPAKMQVAGAIYALTFAGFYLYFQRVETVRRVAVESVSA